MDDKSKMYRGLRFESRIGRISNRLIVVGIVLVFFTLLWWMVPASFLYWLLLPPVGFFIWMASYGWRQALATVQNLLRRLEQI